MEFRHKRDKLRAGESYNYGNERSILEEPGVERFPMPRAGVKSESEMYNLSSGA
jgi:hypothetical protein